MAAGGNRVVITGVASHWGSELARALARDPSVSYIAGVDVRPPEDDLERTEFIEADIRNPVISRILPGLDPDVLVHCGIVWYPEPDKPARSLHDINVIGTLQLLAAAEKCERLRAVVARGSAAIYGSEAAAPSFFTEDMARRYPLKTRFQRDIGELESYFDNFARRQGGITCTMLRFQPEIGPGLDQPLVSYLNLPVVPTQLGFDPRLQLIHAEDATGALAAAVANPVRGAVNVAPDGTISLTKILRLAGRPTLPIPHPVAAMLLGRLGRQLGAADLYSDGVLLLRYGRGCDNRRLKEEVGYRPRFDAEATVRDFVAKSGASRRLVSSVHPGHLARRAGSPL
ncbi:MAG TPA: NAD-dependent epimerase/dehydratase family protein [Solirubrobacterales bacterium]|nr:NAD-dependent epimerase/dehydratase family protein [Solirubrobacterales bacterium]